MHSPDSDRGAKGSNSRLPLLSPFCTACRCMSIAVLPPTLSDIFHTPTPPILPLVREDIYSFPLVLVAEPTPSFGQSRFILDSSQNNVVKGREKMKKKNKKQKTKKNTPHLRSIMSLLSFFSLFFFSFFLPFFSSSLAIPSPHTLLTHRHHTHIHIPKCRQ